SSGTSGESKTDDRRRALEEVAVVLPADGAVHRRAAVPVLLDAGHYGAARRRALPAVEPSAVFTLLDLESDARPRQEPGAGDAVQPLDVEHDVHRARRDADLARLRRIRRLRARAPQVPLRRAARHGDL